MIWALQITLNCWGSETKVTKVGQVSKTVKGRNDGLLHLGLIIFWTCSIVNIQIFYLLPRNGISPFYRTQHSKYFHLKTGVKPAPETYWSHFITSNDETSPEEQQHLKALLLVTTHFHVHF